MTQPIRVGVAGAGYFAQFHYDAWHRMSDAQLVATVDRDATKTADVASRFAIPHQFESVAALLDAVEIDLLDVAMPPAAHLPAIEAAAAHGIDVICQKPFCDTYAGARHAVELAEAAGIRLVVHENFRFQPWHRKIKALVAEGAVGTVKQITFRMRPGDGQGADAYLNRQPYFQTMERFLVHETAIHLIDVFRFLLGEPQTVYADLARLNPAIAGEDTGLIVLGYDDGVKAVFDGCRLLDHVAENRRLTIGDMWIEGLRGTLRLDGDGGLHHRRFGENEERTIDYTWSRAGFAGDCVFALQRATLDALRAGEVPENTAAAYLANLAIEDAVYRSNETGQRLTLSKDGPDAPIAGGPK